MAKKTISEKKDRKKKVTINKRNKSVIKTEKKIKYEKSKVAAMENSINSNQNNLLYSLINSLDNMNTINEPEADFELDFPSNLKEKEFVELFINGLKRAKQNFKKENLIILKSILTEIMKMDGKRKNIFPFLLNKNELLKIYKMDFLLSIIANEQIIESIKSPNMKDSLENFRQLKEFILFVQKDVFEYYIEYNDNKGDMNIKKFENLLYSKSTLSTYKELIYELYGKNVELKEIKENLKEYRKKHKIYFIDMPNGLYGLCIYDGTILLNRIYYDSLIRDPTNVFIIFLTLFHEYAHILSRLFRGDKNYFNNTGEFTKKNNINVNESGEFFEELFLFKSLPQRQITMVESKFLLDKKNYIYDSSQEFRDNFENFRKKNISLISVIPAVLLSKKKDLITIPRIGCSFAGLRLKI